ncbi:fumarate/nitrate reduction transcriptional regulator [compost metagenome]
MERLAISLIVIREKFKTETVEGQKVMVDISRGDLANMAGLAKENVIRMLKELKDEGIIGTEGRKIWVEDIGKLVARSNFK